MSKNFAVIGGDLRIVRLAQILAKDNKVYVYGQEKCDELKNYRKNNIIINDNLENVIKNAQIIISSIPFSKDGINIYAPFTNRSIKIEDLANCIDGKTFFAGSIRDDFYQILNSKNINANVIDLMEQEDLTILNTIATAEGAISDIILNTEKTIHGSEILILGFGRVAKVLAVKLKALEAKVTCAARKYKDFAWMEALGLNCRQRDGAFVWINELGEELQKYDVIVNTVPHLILDENKLKYVTQECLLIDLASKPGGIDQKACQNLGLKFIWALAIPGKVAPKMSANYIKETIDKILKEGAEN